MVKLWARKRGIYSNIYGYLGGISWAILVAQTCISFPNYEVNKLFYIFFSLFDIWKWPRPVILTSIEVPDFDDFKIEVNVWNPNVNEEDTAYVMPIITPNYPQFNTSVNVSKSTLKVIKREFHRAYLILKHKDEEIESSLNELYRPLELTEDFRMFLKLQIMSEDKQNEHKWTGYIQSKLRILTLSLEKIENLSIRPFPKLFEDRDGNSIFIGLKHKDKATSRPENTSEAINEESKLTLRDQEDKEND